MIRAATMDDVSAINRLLNACAQDMHQQGMSHWLGVYSEMNVEQNIAAKRVFVIEEQASLAGCIALGEQAADYYPACWPHIHPAQFYITQLAVHPERQGRGLGKQLMAYCLNALSPGQLVQLDAVAHYPALHDFYHSLGFRIIETGIGLGDKRHLFQLEA